MDEVTIDREALAAYAHEAWSEWMKYIFQECKYHPMDWAIPFELRIKWERQMLTPYHRLYKEEKESDREQADKIIAILRGEQ